MITLEEFKARCVTDSAEDIVDTVLLEDNALHVGAENRAYLLDGLVTAFGVDPSSIQLWVVGSLQKLGFPNCRE